MTLDTAKATVNFILENLKKKNENKGSLTYFGGEPMLLYDEIIVPLTNWIKENNYPIDLSMTTNGTLLNKERIDFLKANNFNLLLSIDGNKKTQEYNRPCRNSNLNSFTIIEDNIEYLLQNFPNITFRSTIYAPTVQETFNNYTYAMGRGFQNIFMMPDGRHEWTKEQMEILGQELDKIFMSINFAFNKGIQVINFSPLERILQSLIDYATEPKELNISRQCNRCGLGTSFGAIGYDGSIYGCQEQPSKDENNIFYIGNIETGIDINLHTRLLEKYNEKKIATCIDSNRCDNCLLRKICLGWACPSSSWDLFQDLHIDSVIACFWREKMFANAMLLYNDLKDNEMFKKYFEGVIKR